MWIMAVCQFDLSPLEIFKDLRAQILSPTFISIGAISPMPFHDVPSGRTETFFSLFPQQFFFHSKQTSNCDYHIRYYCTAMEYYCIAMEVFKLLCKIYVTLHESCEESNCE